MAAAVFATLPVAAALALVALVAATAALAAGRLVGRLFGRTDDDVRLPRVVAATRKLVGLGVFAVVAAVLAPPALAFIGVDTDVGLGDEEVVRWASETGVRIAVLCLLAFVASRLAGAMITHAEARVVSEDVDNGERRKRATTLGTTARHASAVLIWSIGALMVLRELEMDITPILTGAGILGPGDRLRRADARPGHHLRHLPHHGEPAPRGRRGPHQRRRRDRRADQPADRRAAGYRWHGARHPERRDSHARQPQQGLRVGGARSGRQPRHGHRRRGRRGASRVPRPPARSRHSDRPCWPRSR